MADSKKKEATDQKEKTSASKSGTSGKNTGTKRQSTKKSGTAQSKKKSSDKEAENKSSTVKTKEKSPAGSRMRDEITAIFMIALSIFLILSTITTATGEFGVIFSMVLKGCFGLAAYILPFYILIYAVLILMNRMARVNSRSIFFTFLMYFDIVILNSSRFAEVKSQTVNMAYVKEMFAMGANLDSAGIVGMLPGWLLVKCVDIAGMWIIGIVVMLICIMMIADTPFSVFFDKQREKRQKRLEEKNALQEDEAAETMPEIKKNEALTGKNAKQLTIQDIDRKIKESDSNKLSSTNADMAEKNYSSDDFYENNGKSDEKHDSPFANLKIKSAALFKNMGAAHQESETAGMSGKAAIPDNRRQILEYMNDDELLSQPSQGINWGVEDEYSDIDFTYTYDEPEADSSDFRLSSEPLPDEMGAGILERLRDNSKEPEAEVDEGWQNALMSADAVAEDMGSAEDISAFDDSLFAADIADGDGVAVEKIAAEQASEEVKKLSKAEVRTAVTKGAEAVNAEITQKQAPKKEYRLPPITLLNQVERKENTNEMIELHEKAARLEQVLHDFGVNARVIDVKKGPAVTRYEIQPATGVKVNSIVRLTDDIALNLEAKSLRIEAPIPGKAAVGIEVENESSIVVSLREMIESQDFQTSKSKISFVVGEDIAGNSVVADLKGMPHLLIAGSTGSGKSVCINSIIMSMLYKSTPDEVKFILIDPKVVELGNYNGIPHMLIPVVTDPSKAAAALAWAVQEMNDRYKKFAEYSVRDMKAYNEKLKKEGKDDKVLPQIVIIIDELADLMMAAAKQVEESICRLAQLARAAGMHLVVATQRPSVDVVTGLIKANIPSRIAFAVSSQVDSRTILDRAGAEKLVGKGDMLFNPLGKAQPERLQGPFVTDDEVTAVIDFWKAQNDTESDFAKHIMAEINTIKPEFTEGGDEEEDELLDEAIDLVLSAGQASASMLQRRFRIGFNRAGRLVDIMQARGIIGPSEGSKPRRVLMTKDEYEGNVEAAAEAAPISEEIYHPEEKFVSAEIYTGDEPEDFSENSYGQHNAYEYDDMQVSEAENWIFSDPDSFSYIEDSPVIGADEENNDENLY